MTKEDQIPLNFTFCTEKSFDNFIVGDNRIVLEMLKNFDKNEPKLVFLHGKKSSGKTHLCRSVFDSISEKKKYVTKDNFNQIREIDTQEIDYLIIDDLDLILLNSDSEDDIFYIINELILLKKYILVSSSCSINDINFSTQDLKSRIKSGLVLKINDMNDADKMNIIKKITEERGWSIDQKVCEYIFNHYQRDLFFLCNVLKNLDEKSLSMKKNITVPFVKRIITSKE